jgi:hypothetical protein
VKKLSVRDGIATLALLAVLIPYIGFLIRGEMPLIEDARGMAAVGLAGLIIAVAAWGFRSETTFGRIMLIAILVTVGLGLAALIVGVEGSAILLALFIGAMVVVWLAETLFDAGKIHLAS